MIFTDKKPSHITRNNTKVFADAGMMVVRLHSTDVVKFDADSIVLNTGGYNTVTTRRRMNEASKQFALGYKVFSKDFSIHVTYGENTFPFDSKIILYRNGGKIV